MNGTKHAILITIYKILVKGKKHYVEPSVDAIIDLLHAYHKTDIKRRWALECLRELEELGYIIRRQRYLKNNDNEIMQIPSLITITLAGARKLYSQGVDGASRLIQEILSWIRRNDKRWPQSHPALQPSDARAGSREVMPIKNVLAEIGFA